MPTENDPALLRQEGNNAPQIWRNTLESLATTYPHLKRKPLAMLQELRRAQSNDLIPWSFEGKRLECPQLRWVNKELKKIRDKESNADNERVYFPESFRESIERTFNQEKKLWEDVVHPPKLPPEAVPTAMLLIKVFNEKGFERPTVRLVKNLDLLLHAVPMNERANAINTLVMAGLVLSYGDTTNDPNAENSSWRYVEGFLAYGGWKDTNSLDYKVWKEATTQTEQEIEGAEKNDYKEGFLPNAIRLELIEGVPPQRRMRLPARANLQSYPFPEMVRVAEDKNGKAVEVAFQHPAQFAPVSQLGEAMEASYSGSVIGGDGFNITLERTRKEDSVSAYERLKEDNPDVYNDSIP
jgi:hypothetical protein